jgi:hypothetical protein
MKVLVTNVSEINQWVLYNLAVLTKVALENL